MNKKLLYTLRWLIDDGLEKEDNRRQALKIIGGLLGESPLEGPQGGVASPSYTKPRPGGYTGKVALVIGHNSKGKGAFVKGRFNQFEYDFNGQIASIMTARAPSGLDLKTFRRRYVNSYSREISTVYGEVNSWNPDFILELHFNSYPNGDYSFMLYNSSSSTSKKLAAEVNRVFCAKTGFKSNQQNGGRSSGRGYASLSKSKAPCVLSEPFFENNPTHLAKIESLGHGGMADLYLEAIRSIYKKKLI